MKRPLFLWVTILITLLDQADVVRFYLAGGDPLVKGASLELIEALRNQTGLEQLIGIFHLILSFVAAVALLLLQPVALPIFAVIFVLAVLRSIEVPFPHLISIWPPFVGLAVNGMLLWYVWQLRRKGVLRSAGAISAGPKQ